ncbi:MAG: bifunctional phosphoglucose/phosphomannose isomerase [Patescibacteria group bacterium]
MMDQAIRDFSKQFLFKPQIEGSVIDLANFSSYVVCGMGGSHLAADILKRINPKINLIIHSDYGLPELNQSDLSKVLVIISSYSGNTEETLDALEKALAKGLTCLTISVGGQLLQIAKEKNLPYIQLPDTGIQPRSALGFSLMAMLKAVNQEETLKEVNKLSAVLNPTALENRGEDLAEQAKGRIPVIYASTKNYALAYNWKIKLNETGKIPAFYNLLPELNHNEMTGYDYTDLNRSLSDKFFFIILLSATDDVRNKKRAEVLARLLEDKELLVLSVDSIGQTDLENIFNSLILADWFAYYTALIYEADPSEVPLVEEFKSKLAN